MVSSVAHELNNPLSAILLFTEDLLATDPNPQQVEGLTLIAQQVRRSRGIVRDLLSLTRPAPERREQVDPARLLRDVVKGLRPQIDRAGVSVSVIMDGPPMVARLDRVGLEQVVTNLVMNGVQASGAGGHVWVRGSTRDGILIEVVDDGPGIPSAALPRIFEPFFTTKPAGQGTGLGLAVSMGLVKRSGGTLTAGNRLPAEGGGAMFVVRLPAERISATPPLLLV